MNFSPDDRVPESTASSTELRIRRQIHDDVAASSSAGRQTIGCRLAELEREWDTERIIELEAPLTILAGLALTATVDRKWIALPLFASSMLLLHSLQGWYPLVPLLRRIGVRTQKEISTARYALQVMRGDFD